MIARKMKATRDKRIFRKSANRTHRINVNKAVRGQSKF